MEIGNLSRKEFKVMARNMIKELGSEMDEQGEESEIFNKEKIYKEELNRDGKYNN